VIILINKENVWFITGCSTGFGREIAKKVIAAGYKVAVTARNKSKIEDLIVNNEENALALILDVTDKSQVREAVTQTVEKFGRIDILVNNAGLQRDSRFVDMTLEQWNTVISINLTGQFLCSREAAKEFIKRGVVEGRSRAAGKIICMSSVHEVIPWAGTCKLCSQ